MVRWNRWRACANYERERERVREIQGGIFDFVVRTVLLHRLISQRGIAHGWCRVVRSHLVSYQRCPWESWRAKCLSWLIKDGERGEEASPPCGRTKTCAARTISSAKNNTASRQTLDIFTLDVFTLKLLLLRLNEAGRCAFAREIIGALYNTIKITRTTYHGGK